MAQAATTLPEARSTPTVDFGAWGLRASVLIYLGALVVLPLVVISVEGFRSGLDSLWASITRPAALQSIWLSVWTAAIMAVVNVFMGTLTAVVLARYRFPGKKLFNALIDLPFAIPTLVIIPILMLRPMKGVLLAQQWKTNAHEGRVQK